MNRFLLIALCLAAAGCTDKRDIPVATEGGKPGFIVNGSLYGLHPTVDDAKADAVTRVHGQCPNGAEAISATLTQQMTTGYLTNTYQATVVCK